jgi:DNA polymerase I-like protein with 3'-5' exonuclease and polymerase domains
MPHGNYPSKNYSMPPRTQKNFHLGGVQLPLITPTSDWTPPSTLPDLRRVGVLALDVETRDEGLAAKRGSAWPTRGGHICGVSVAWREAGTLHSLYAPIAHPDTQCLPRETVAGWLRGVVASDVHIVTQGGLYDWGWLRADLGVTMPPGERVEEVGAAATMVDENRLTYNLDDLCEWRGLPGKDEGLLREAAAAYGFGASRDEVKRNLWRLPARYVGPYAAPDAVQTLLVWESLHEVIRSEGTEAAYRLECALLPLVHEMRRRGVRVDIPAAERARDALLAQRDAVFEELRDKLGERVGMEEIGRTKWLERVFAAHAPEVAVPRTAATERFPAGQASFTAGSTGWMHKSKHWLPRLVVRADKYNNAATKFLQGYILDYATRGRIHAEVHPHRSDEGGTRSLRFSYSHPPLQQMTARDEELSPLIRGVFLPEDGEVWAKPDVSQQEYRFIVHYAARLGLPKAAEAVQMYRDDPRTDFHDLCTKMFNPGLDFDHMGKVEFKRLRDPMKDTNFAKSFGAGVPKFAAMIGRTVEEAAAIYTQYDEKLPFVQALFEKCESLAARRGYITLYDGARRHWTDWQPRYLSGGEWARGRDLHQRLNPCPHEEALARTRDAVHVWHGKTLRRADTRKGMNALIQGSAARHTKLWMIACWREGIVPLLQLHDELDTSVKSREEGEMVVRLGVEAVRLEVPVRVKVTFGRNWGDALHEWDELKGEQS